MTGLEKKSQIRHEKKKLGNYISSRVNMTVNSKDAIINIRIEATEWQIF